MSDYSQILEELKLTYAYIDFLEAGGTGTPPMAPIIKDVPTVTGSGIADTALTVTNGNWRGAPTEYHYAWKGGSTALGTDANTYTPVAADTGKQISCVVSAVNAMGTTVAPPSNAIEIVPAGAQQAAPAQAEPRAHAAPAANHSQAHR